MKHFYHLLLILVCGSLAACKPEPPVPPIEPPVNDSDTVAVYVPLTEWERADSLYTVADYTVPSHTMFKLAQFACANNPTEENLDAMRQRIKELVSKQEPYCMVATINGDPKTSMGFCWFTNDSIFEGEVQLIAKADATEADFAAGMSRRSRPRLPKPKHYATLASVSTSSLSLAWRKTSSTNTSATRRWLLTSHPAPNIVGVVDTRGTGVPSRVSVPRTTIKANTPLST